jgi:catechol 2,3-dioxygenase
LALTWSHAVLYVRDVERMLDFYTRVLNFEITDRGPLRGGPAEIIFLSQSPVEHHQVAFVPTSNDPGTASPLVHVAFRAEGLGDLRSVIGALDNDAVTLRPISHGNTWSVYFQDPEDNGIEIFCETPWHVQQPAGETWDLGLSDDALREWTEDTFQDAAEFGPIDEFYARRAKALASA